MLKSISEKISSSEKPILKVIFRNNNTRIVGLGLKKGMKMIDHQLPVTTKIIVINGKLIIDSKIEIKMLEEYSEYEIPSKVIHQVKVLEDSMVLLVLDFSK